MEPDIRKGLEGVIADKTAVSRMDPATQTLTYRGYPVTELAERCGFEEVAYLLWYGELPTRAQLKAFQAVERKRRALPDDLLFLLQHSPAGSHPMDVLRTAVSYLGLSVPVAHDVESQRRQTLDLLARIPTIVAVDARARQGLAPIPPRSDLSLAENVFWMTFGRVPHPDIVKAFEVALILYAEHGFNASTFAARVVTSTMADLHGAVTAGIAALKGALHGGANEAVIVDLAQVGTPENARTWLRARLSEHRKIMGFGHRVYRNGDSRVPLAAAWGRRVAAIVGNDRWHAIGDVLREAMREEKGIHPNLDFETGPMYALMGFAPAQFTPIFVMGRVVGWTAHILEQAADNRLIRPMSFYVGVPARPFVPIERRVATEGEAEPVPATPRVRARILGGPRQVAAGRNSPATPHRERPASPH
jgi:2-methylcitrate synthase